MVYNLGLSMKLMQYENRNMEKKTTIVYKIYLQLSNIKVILELEKSFWNNFYNN